MPQSRAHIVPPETHISRPGEESSLKPHTHHYLKLMAFALCTVFLGLISLEPHKSSELLSGWVMWA